MQAIETKYLPATNTRGSRIKATSASGLSVTVPYLHEARTGEAGHWAAAAALAIKLKWDGEYVSGSTKAGYVFVRLAYENGIADNLHVVLKSATA